MIRSATISQCGCYRFDLVREFEPGDELYTPQLDGTCAVVLNNPSIADAQQEDPTSRRGIGYTAFWGYRRLCFGNGNPFRSTNPKLARIPPEEVLLENDKHLRRIAREASVVVAAWGDKANPQLAARALRVLREVAPVYALAFSKAGVPRHPLYLLGSLQPQLWRNAVNGDGSHGPSI